MFECDKEKQKIVIRTKNKKYFKRFNISDLVRLNINLGDNLMKVNFMNNIFHIRNLMKFWKKNW